MDGSQFNPSPEPRSPLPASLFDVSGAAARTRLTGYRANSGEVQDRSLEGLLAWAAQKGLHVPSYIRIIPVEEDETFQLRKNGERVDAKYFEAKDVPEGESIYWDHPNALRSVFNREFGRVVVNISQGIMENDERFLHVVAHEVFEIEDLKAVFDECGGEMPVARFYELTEPLTTAKNLHWFAWEKADSLIERIRGQ
jgi:hypothetical protein